MGKLGLWERATLNAAFMGTLRGEECVSKTETAVWLIEVMDDPKLTFRRDEIIREMQRPQGDVLGYLATLVDHGLLKQIGKAAYRITLAGATALANEAGCIPEFADALSQSADEEYHEIGLPLAA